MKDLVRSIINTVEDLNHEERRLVKLALDGIEDRKKVYDIVESIQDSVHHCPYCESRKVYKHGIVSSLQRYRCRSCRKTFNALTGTPLSRLRKKELWLKYFDLMMESRTLRYIEKKLGIDKKTAFLWRHRFTINLVRNLPKKLTGIVEIDETYFRFSQKGCKKMVRKPHKRGGGYSKRGLSKDQVCVLAACNRSGKDFETIAGLGTATGQLIEKKLKKIIAKDSVVVTDGLISYRYFCRRNDLTHEIVKNRTGLRIKGSYHIQNVNNIHGRLKSWIIGVFKGVATKYLDHYLWWFHVLKNRDIHKSIDFFKLSLTIPHLTGT